MVDELRQVALVRVENLQTALTDAKVAECARPAVLRVGNIASLAAQWVVSVGSSVHNLVLVEAVIMRGLEAD